jgi:hypothetical protein
MVKKKHLLLSLIFVIFVLGIFGLNIYAFYQVPKVDPVFKIINNVKITKTKYPTSKLDIIDVGTRYESTALVSYGALEEIRITSNYSLICSPNQNIKEGTNLASYLGSYYKSEVVGRIVSISIFPDYYLIQVERLKDSIALITISNSTIIREDLSKELNLGVELSYKQTEIKQNVSSTKILKVKYDKLEYSISSTGLEIRCLGLDTQLLTGFVLDSTILFIKEKEVLAIDKRCVEYVYFNTLYVRLIEEIDGVVTTKLDTLTLVKESGDFYQVKDSEKIGNDYFLNMNKTI